MAVGSHAPRVASQRLLDTYRTEREPHVTEIIRQSIAAGELVCTTDPEAARRRASNVTRRQVTACATGSSVRNSISTESAGQAEARSSPRKPGSQRHHAKTHLAERAWVRRPGLVRKSALAEYRQVGVRRDEAYVR